VIAEPPVPLSVTFTVIVVPDADALTSGASGTSATSNGYAVPQSPQPTELKARTWTV
jgi:hypothetical protein